MTFEALPGLASQTDVSGARRMAGSACLLSGVSVTTLSHHLQVGHQQAPEVPSSKYGSDVSGQD